MYKVNLSVLDVDEAGRCFCNELLNSPGNAAHRLAVQAAYDSFDFKAWTDKANREGLSRTDGDIWHAPGFQWVAVLENDLLGAYYEAYARLSKA